MIKWIFGLLLILGGLGWAAMVIMATGMADRATTIADTWSAWVGVAAIVLGAVVLIWG